MISETIITALSFSLFTSVWQAALIWLLFLLFQYRFPLPAKNTYWLLLTLICILFVSWGANFIYFIFNPSPPTLQLLAVSFELENFNLPISLYSIIAMLYSLGCLYQGFRFLQSLYQLKFLAKHQLPLPADAKSIIDDMRITHQVLSKITLRATLHTASPLTYGWLKPIIFFPVAALNRLRVEEVQSIVLHELAHIRRNDFLHECLISSIEIVMFYNPFVRLLMNQLREEREKACDDEVIESGIPVYFYANALMVFAKKDYSHQSIPALAFAGNQPRLLNRIKRLASPEHEKKDIPLFSCCLCLVVLLAGLIWMSGTRKAGNIKHTSSIASMVIDRGLNAVINLPQQMGTKPAVIKRSSLTTIQFPKRLKKAETLSSTVQLNEPTHNKPVLPVLTVAQQTYAGLTKIEQLHRSMQALPDSISLAFTANAIAKLSPHDRVIWMEALQKLYNENPENASYISTINLQAPFIIFLRFPISAPLSGIALQCLTNIREQVEAYYEGNHIMTYSSSINDSTRMATRSTANQ